MYRHAEFHLGKCMGKHIVPPNVSPLNIRVDGTRNVLFSSISCSVAYIVLALCCFPVFLRNRCLLNFESLVDSGA